MRCFPRWTRALEQLTVRTLERLAANEPVDPNDPDAWRSRDAHAQAVLHRHGKGKLSATRLTSAAITALIDGQAAADRDAGLDWSTVTTPASTLDERLARAHATLPVDLDDPRVWAYQLDQRRALARPLGLDDHRADDLSRWVLANPSQFDAGDLRCWRIGSDTWLSLAGEQLGAVGKVERPVGVFVVPAMGSSDGWQLMPVLALDAIRLVAELGGRLERDLRSAVIADRQPRRAARADQRAHAARRAEGVPGLRRAARAGALARARTCRSARACRATSATGGGGSPSTAAPTRAPTARARPSSSCGCSRSRRAGSPSGGSGRRRARSSTRTRAR